MQLRSSRMTRWLLIIGAGILAVCLLLVLAVYFYYRSGRGLGSPTQLTDAPAPTTIPLVDFITDEGINLPPGFNITRFADGLDGPRMFALGPDGMLYVTERGAGRVIRLPDHNGDGRFDGVEVAADDLVAPSGLAFYQDGSLYVAEPGRVLRFAPANSQGKFTNPEVIVDGIPTSGHNTRTLAFSPDWQTLYVSIGSSCNTCLEEDDRRAAIMRYNPDGSGGQIFARGLRNAVGLALEPGSNRLWASNNGSDWLGDDLPPETVNQVSAGDDFGWPRCHAGRIIDPEFGGQEGCTGVNPPAVEIQAHSAPLGLAFYTGENFPAEYQGDLFVALHGSWNRTEPTGYKVVRIPFQDGQPGPAQDFAWGWLQDDGARSGRPVDVITGPDGAFYISDDSQGVIYRLVYQAP